MRGIDVSNYDDAATPQAARAVICSQNIRKVTVGAQFQATWEKWRQFAASFPPGARPALDAYLYLYNPGSSYWPEAPSFQAQIDRVRSWCDAPLWLDVEDLTGTLPSAQALWDACNYADGVLNLAGVYTAAYALNAVGNPQLGQKYRLWNAAYDSDPNIQDVNYGGWIRPAGKQYVGSFSSYGLSFGLDVWEG